MMAVFTLDGIYENGKIELEAWPPGVARARVRVTFLPDADAENETEDREAARQRALARMRTGINFGGEKFRREEIYEDRLQELQARQDSRP